MTARPSLEEAQRLTLACCPALTSERVAAAAAVGRFAAETIAAQADLVPFARSAMDGIAVAAGEVPGSYVLPLAGSVFAERGTSRHVPGTATRIATGAPLPAGADAVVPIEALEIRDGWARGSGPVNAGDHVFPPGEDARAGDILVRAGDALGPAALALLAANGTIEVMVTRRPRVTIVTTGTEIVAPGETPATGQIRNSNATLLGATIRAAGAEVIAERHAVDDDAALRAILSEALAASDLVVTTGGASVGERDRVKAVLAELAVDFAFTSVALRPAKPTGAGRHGSTAVVTLPGNPAAAFVGLHEFVMPAVRLMAGAPSPLPPRVVARLRGRLHGKAARTFAAFAALSISEQGVLEAVPLENQCSALTRLGAEAAGFIVVEPGERRYQTGALVAVDVIDWDRLRRNGSRHGA